MLIVDPALLTVANQFKNQLLTELFGVLPQAGVGTAALTDVIPQESNILGVGYGAKVTAGAAVEELAIRVYVRAKLPQSLVPAAEAIPSTVTNPLTGQGLPTDVIPVGDVTAFWPRPVPCGVSVGHHAITAGTLGCLVQRNDSTADQFILSNNHVLADSSSSPSGTRPPQGDSILEPGPIDGGTAHPRIAELTDWVPINFTGTNTMDTAIAKVLHPGDVLPNINVIGRVAPHTTLPKLYQSVRKHGRTTLHTVGVIMDLSARIKVRYGTRLATFDNQLGIVGAGGTFSSGGDSGSLIVDAVTLEPVALLFAGGGGTTFANPINPILSHFNVRIV
jgi:hypothetical protein